MEAIEIDQNGARYIVRKNGKRYYEKECNYCGTAYFPKRESQKYCCQSCNVRACMKRNNYPKKLRPQILEAGDEVQGIEKKLEEIANNTKIKKSDIMAATTLANISYDVIKDIGKTAFGIKSPLEKHILEIRRDLRKVLHQTKSLQPTGKRVQVSLGRGTKTAVLVEYKDYTGRILYELESMEDSQFFNPF